MNTLKLTQIVPDANQPRKYFAVEKMATLKASIKKHGIMSPVTVQKQGDHYMLVDGERRFRAASELKLKEVPVNIIPPKDNFTRLVEQFHIQEQHESWSPTEKAMAILEISKLAKKPMKEICEMLGINERTVRYYTAFGELANKDRFIKYQCSLENAEKIKEVKNFAKRIKENTLGEPFTKADESVIEKMLIEKIKDREITERGDYTRIKDIFRTDPKMIDKFMSGSSFDINETFSKSKAAGARYIRNMMQNCNYVVSNGYNFLKNPDVKMSEQEIWLLKRTAKTCLDVVKMAE